MMVSTNENVETRTSPGLRPAPRVSIGLPVYNGGKYLRDAVESILAQTFENFELIISDNGSTDDTQAICEAFAASDSRVRYVRSEMNRGASWNFNNVFELSRGEYFRQAAHDDTIAPTCIERCVDALDADRTAVVAYPRTIVTDADGNEIWRFRHVLDLSEARPHERLRHFHRRVTDEHDDRVIRGANHDCHPIFGLMRTADLRGRPGGILPDFVGSDVILLAEQAARGRFLELPEYLFYMRTHDESSCSGEFVDQVARARWFNPQKATRVTNYLLLWRWLFEFIAATNRVPMPPLERLRCHAVTAAFAWRKRVPLLRQAISAFARMIRLRPLEARTLPGASS